jgi:hypothetical protein
MKLFDAQRRRETAKPLQYLELIKATFDCGRNIRQRSAGVRRHKGNSLDPRKDDFLKLMMQSSHFLKINYCTVFLRHVQRLLFFQDPALDRECNPHTIAAIIFPRSSSRPRM